MICLLFLDLFLFFVTLKHLMTLESLVQITEANNMEQHVTIRHGLFILSGFFKRAFDIKSVVRNYVHSKK